MSTGVDESCSITLLFSDQRMAQINVSIGAARFDSAYLVGDKGVIQVMSLCLFRVLLIESFLESVFLLLKITEHLWSPTEYIRANGERVVEQLPECEAKTNFQKAIALRFEAEEVRLAIGKGLLEHPNVTHDNSRLIMTIMEEAKNQLGYYS